MQVYSPKAIANYFIELAKAKGEKLTPMKLQKLVYYAVGWYAGYTGQPLVDEAIEAWQYGPVIPSLYHQFKKFGSMPITEKATDFGPGFNFEEVPPPNDPNILKFLENVWASYGKFTGIRLSEMTHAKGGPWDLTWSECTGFHGVDIPFDRIASHFRTAAANAQQMKVAS